MAGERVEITGLRELIVKCKAMDVGLVVEVKAIGTEAARVVADEAKSLVPHLTGRLGASIRTGSTQKGANVKAGGGDVVYAGVIHFGWPHHNISPQPFLYDALDARRDAVLAIYEERIAALTERVF